MPATSRFNAYQERVFGAALPALSRLVEVLELAPFTHPHHAEALKVSRKLESCCRGAAVVRSEDGDDIAVHEMRCKHRMCPRCGRDRARSLISKIRQAVETMDSPGRIDLTVRSTDAPLRDQIKHLTQSFARLRRSPGWKEHVRGGIHTIEITWNEQREQWHPHIHAVVDLDFWRHDELRRAWKQASGDSSIVWIQRIKSPQQAAQYVAGYVAKSSDVKALPDAQLPEYAVSIRGLRFVQTFGSLHGTKITPERIPLAGSPLHVIRCNVLASHANQGVADAAHLLAKITAFHRDEFPHTSLEWPADRAGCAAVLIEQLEDYLRREGHSETSRSATDAARRARAPAPTLWGR